METIRTFIAIPLPDALLKRLSALQERLETEVPHRSMRWVKPTGIHLTLKFLGDISTERLPEIKQALTAVAQNAPACQFTVGELGCFPNPSRPRVLWVGVQEPSGRLNALQDAIEEALDTLGYAREKRGFTPHLTLGRVQRKVSHNAATRIGDVVQATPVEQLAHITAEHFALIRSDLKPTGAAYTTLATFDLKR